MKILQNKPLRDYVSMRIGGPAAYIAIIETEADIAEAITFAKEQNKPLITLGDGTNVVFSDVGFDGLVLINKMIGFSATPEGAVTVAAGENWDETVARTIELGLVGIESLSLVPGTAGAAPVNNIGAYGQEIAETITSVRAYDTQNNEFIELPNTDCNFSYRNSRFKNEDHGRFIICSITLQLLPADSSYRPPSYPSMAAELAKYDQQTISPSDVRSAVIAVRTSKLPDPAVTPNSGSFFKNPVVSKQEALALQAKYPDMPTYSAANGVKIAAGWLIEQAGLKNHRQNGVWVYDKQALVLVNESAESFSDLWAMVTHIQSEVLQKFGVSLVPEPELL